MIKLPPSASSIVIPPASAPSALGTAPLQISCPQTSGTGIIPQASNRTLLVKLDDGTYGQLQLQQRPGLGSPSTSLVPVFLRQIPKPTSLSAGVKRTVQDRRNESTIRNAQRIFVVESPREGLSPTLELVENAIVDEASLQKSMTKNRESLKVKLLSRPSRVRLVQQGILPASSTPPRFHEQKLKLERARMGDVLKHKIEQRPDKQQLVSQHILLCESSLDPNVQEKQRQLKKCKLADSLNDKLAHRPGPLELVQENILHVDEALEQAVKDGRLQFKPTSAGMAQKHPNPVFLVQEIPDEAQSNGDLTRQTVMLGPVEVPTDMLSSIPSQHHSSVMSFYDSATTCSSSSAPSTPRPAPAPPSTTSPISPPPPSITLKSRPKFKKPKSSKTLSSCGLGGGGSVSNGLPSSGGTGSCPGGKSKIIKFHEYKGPSNNSATKSFQQPPNGLKPGVSIGQDAPNSSATSNLTPSNPGPCSVAETKDSSAVPDPSSETSYELLLHQQQLFLQWQLELQQKYPNSRFQLLPMWTGSGAGTSLSFSAVPTGETFAPASPSQAPSPNVKPFVIPVTTSDGSGAPEVLTGLHQGLFSSSETGMKAGGVGLKGETPPPTEVSSDVAKKTEKQKHNSSKPPVNPTKLEDLRVSDLKAECKKRNLPVSGPKPNLLEKLKPYAEHIIQNWKNPSSEPSEPENQQTSQSSSVQSLPPIQDVTGFLSTPVTTSSSSFLTLPNQLRAPASTGHNPTGFLQASPAGSDISRSVSTDTSGVASNYSSPGIDLSGLSFGGQNNGGSTASNCFTFAAGGSGGQFTLNTNDAVSQATCETPPSRIDPMSFSMDTSAPPSLPASETSPRESQPEQGKSQMGAIFTSAMSATTLSVHEEMLRHQQRKIEELQRELQRSQEQLKHQQQVILAARKAQNEKSQSHPQKSIRESEAEAWLANIDTKHLQKFHIQQFLQHKLQQQQLQQHVALQQELVATQRRLQEDMGVEQAVQDVGRMIKQDPRAASLMVHLLKKYQVEKKEVSTPLKHSPPLSSSNSTPNPKEASKKPQTGNSNPGESSESGGGGKSGGKLKSKACAGSSKKTSAGRSNSMPTSPSKAKSSLSGADMEEIFKSVLDLASKATQNMANNEDGNNNGDSQVDDGKKEDTQKLPSCDQLIPSLRSGNEVEEKMGEEMDGMRAPASSAAGPSLGSLLMNNLPSAMDMLHNDPTGSSFVYTKNEAFEDLLEVLRNNGGEGEGLNQQMFENGRLDDSLNSCYPNTFGAQDLSDLLGNDWLDNSLSQSLDVPSRVSKDTPALLLPGTHKSSFLRTPDGSFLQDFGVRQGSEQQSFHSHNMPSVHSEPNLQHSGSMNSGGSLPSGFDLGSSLENGEQMDWLDLILPSPPAGMDLPPNPPVGDSGFLGSESVMEDSLTPSTPAPSYSRGNPVLAQRIVAHNGTDAFC